MKFTSCEHLGLAALIAISLVPMRIGGALAGVTIFTAAVFATAVLIVALVARDARNSPAIIAFWAVLGILLAGCRVGQSPQEPVKVDDHKPGNAESEQERSPTYVNCQATLTSLENDHPWFENSSSGHDDGRAPLASFVIVEPATYANRTVGILFKYAGTSDVPSPPEQTEVGSRFTLQVPEEFFAGKHKTLDNTTVRNLRNVER